MVSQQQPCQAACQHPSIKPPPLPRSHKSLSKIILITIPIPITTKTVKMLSFCNKYKLVCFSGEMPFLELQIAHFIDFWPRRFLISIFKVNFLKLKVPNKKCRAVSSKKEGCCHTWACWNPTFDSFFSASSCSSAGIDEDRGVQGTKRGDSPHQSP